jgi:hypothetical protein
MAVLLIEQVEAATVESRLDGFVVDQLAVDGDVGRPVHFRNPLQGVADAETHAQDIGANDFHGGVLV